MTVEFDTPSPVVPRDGWKRPLIVPPGGGKPKAYTRCTTFVDCLDDQYHLTAWKKRMVALGLADRPDLLLSVAAHRHDKTILNDLCRQAMDAAQASAGATTGTALHSLTEQLDRGQQIGIIPAAFKADLAAYQTAMVGIEHVAIEQFCVEDGYKIGGTPDRVSRIGDRYVISDVKTGGIDFGAMKIAMQLAVYAHSTPYNPATGQREPYPFDVDTTVALVIHLPAGEGRCNLYWADIDMGWDAVETAAQVRSWRSQKHWMNPYTPQPPTPAAAAVTPDGWVGIAIAQSSTMDALREVWSAAVARGEWTDAHLAAALERKNTLEKAS